MELDTLVINMFFIIIGYKDIENISNIQIN